MKTVDIIGDIISNDIKWAYDWMEYESTCPNDVQSVIDSLEDGEDLVININSGGGEVFAGQEIYSKIKKCKNTIVNVESIAASAAGVIAMAGETVRMSPVAMLMIHNVSNYGGVSGDYHQFEKEAAALKEMNAALASAYCEKSGMPLKDVLQLMDKETWITANQAKGYGFCDEIISENSSSGIIVNGFNGLRITPELIEKCREEKAKADKREKDKKKILDDLYKYGI